MDPKYEAEAQRLVQRAMADAMVTGAHWWQAPYLKTAQELEEADQRRNAPRPPPIVPPSREAILDRRIAEAEKVKRKLEKKIRKAAR